jgi:NAD(P)-dependent dehydrogenase (short-subunit alcohol dehydrogenase family)
MTEKKWCLVLGCSSGIGKASVRTLSKEGWNIIGVHFDIADNTTKIDALVSELKVNSEHVYFFNQNAENSKARAEIISQICEKIASSKIDLFLHSLAFGTLLPFVKSNDENVIQKPQLEMTLSVMAHTLIYWSQDLWEHKLLAGGSKIFAITSVGSHMYFKYYGAVSAAKSALESYMRQLAIEFAPHGISVNCLRAGITDTPALRKIPGHEGLLQRAQSLNPHGRVSTPEDVSEILCGLSKIKHSWMTGNIINVDGGEILTI